MEIQANLWGGARSRLSLFCGKRFQLARFTERRGHDRPGRDSRHPSDEENDTPDNASVISSVSDGASVNGEGA